MITIVISIIADIAMMVEFGVLTFAALPANLLGRLMTDSFLLLRCNSEFEYYEQQWCSGKISSGYMLMARAVVLAYNGGLGSKPSVGVQRTEPLGGVRGAKAP